jgi:Zn-dependent peptidase ImmA (M78 family)/DNA-binding XRE family transcriptional regulator
MSGFGDVLAIARKARGMTQAEVAEAVGVTQVAINRYEAGERDPDETIVAGLAATLGVTHRLLRHGDRFRGALAMDAHMRRQKTTKASLWRRLEARLNLLRVHSSFLFEEVSLRSEQQVPTFDSEYTRPEDAARLVRAQWRLPIGPVTNMTRWLESAGCLVFEEDFGTQRVDGVSQWVGDHPVILINAALVTDRKRLTLGHELGHLVLHSTEPSEDMESQANTFASEFLMPEAVIRSELRRVDLGTLIELKREWGVSIQALYERAYRMGLVTASARSMFYKSLNARGWKTQEPASSAIPAERPELLTHIGDALKAKGLTDEQMAEVAGFAIASENPFQPARSGLRLHLV